MKQRVILINPPLVSDSSDYTGTGTPCWPIILASINSVLCGIDNIEVSVFDLYGLDPNNIKKYGSNYRHGWKIDTLYYVGGNNDVAIVYDNYAIAHETVIEMIKILKEINIKRIIVVENGQHVTAFPLDIVYNELREAGADCVICGDPEGVIIDAVFGKLPDFGRYFVCGDKIPIPNWDGFPIENYWDLPFAHAPKTNRKYIPLLTSRGCFGKCLFCTNPFLNNSRWRARSAFNVFTEIMLWYNRGVREFHIEDLNPTVDKSRIIELCERIKILQIDVDIKIASGTKIETLDKEMLVYMHDAGFSYLSFSPESGSKYVLNKMNKGFNHKYAIDLVRFIKKEFGNSMITQACFILGYPGERNCDIDLTIKYIKKLAKVGLDEIALFNWVPMPGSEISSRIGTDVSFGKLSFSSDWRLYNDYLKRLRVKIVLMFYLINIFNGVDVWFNFRRTKVYMTIKRILLTKLMVIWRAL